MPRQSTRPNQGEEARLPLVVSRLLVPAAVPAADTLVARRNHILVALPGIAAAAAVAGTPEHYSSRRLLREAHSGWRAQHIPTGLVK